MIPFRRLWPVLVALPIILLAMTAPFASLRARAATATRGAHEPSERDRRSGFGSSWAGLPNVAQRRLQDLPLRVVAFGSSSTEGVGASSPSASYPSRLEGELAGLLPNEKVRVINLGIGGEDAEDLARRVPEVVAIHPDLVIFQTGTNDPLRGVPLDRFVTLTRQTVLAIQQAGIDVMLMEPQFCHVTRTVPTAVLYRDALRQLGAEMRTPVVRRWDLMRSWLDHDLLDAAQMLAPDGLHMADAGYALLAKAVARQILSASAPPRASAGAAPVGSDRLQNGAGGPL